MDPRLYLLNALLPFCRQQRPYYWNDVSWEDAAFVRACELRLRRGDPRGWDDFLTHLHGNYRLSCAIFQYFQEIGLMCCNWKSQCISLAEFPSQQPKLDHVDARRLLAALDYWRRNFGKEIAYSEPQILSGGEIRYIEAKPGLSGESRIGRVRFSKTQKTLYYKGRKLQSLKGRGFKANYSDIDTGLEYWVSKCRGDGNDRLYPGIVTIDDDVREEYWLQIRRLPERIQSQSFRSEGKNSKRRPR